MRVAIWVFNPYVARYFIFVSQQVHDSMVAKGQLTLSGMALLIEIQPVVASTLKQLPQSIGFVIEYVTNPLSPLSSSIAITRTICNKIDTNKLSIKQHLRAEPANCRFKQPILDTMGNISSISSNNMKQVYLFVSIKTT